MRNKNGFIATSILYTFFLIFLTLFIALIANYLHNRILLAKIDETSREKLFGINNTKVSDLTIGTHIKFESDDNLLNSDATWILAAIEGSGNTKKYYFISDLTAANINVMYKIPNVDKIKKYHALTVSLYETLSNNGEYNKAISFGGFKVYMTTSSFLAKIRNQISDPFVLSEILNPGGNYLVYIDSTIPGTGPNGSSKTYTAGEYYEMKRYNFSSSSQTSLLSKYCGGSFNGSIATYVPNNTFGYINIANEPIDKNTKYANYCYYASTVAYNHPVSEQVVQVPENKTNDLIISKLNSSYNFRLIAEKELNSTATNTYIAGGKGTSLDPYIFTDGVKQ